MYLYQNSGGLATIMDAEGRSHRIPHEELWEAKPQISMDVDKGGEPVAHTIPADKVAKQLCDDGRFYGVVIVPEVRTGTSIHFDLESATKESTRVREQAETELIESYVKRSKEQALQNMPIRPPAPALQKILDARGRDLDRDYGIKPIGYKISEAAKQRDAEIAELRKDNADLRQMLERVLATQEKAAKKETVKT